MSDRIECCTDCLEPTGRAGEGDDSIYLDTDAATIGPLCEGCYGARADVENAPGPIIATLRADLAREREAREQAERQRDAWQSDAEREMKNVEFWRGRAEQAEARAAAAETELNRQCRSSTEDDDGFGGSPMRYRGPRTGA